MISGYISTYRSYSRETLTVRMNCGLLLLRVVFLARFSLDVFGAGPLFSTRGELWIISWGRASGTGRGDKFGDPPIVHCHGEHADIAYTLETLICTCLHRLCVRKEIAKICSVVSPQ